MQEKGHFAATSASTLEKAHSRKPYRCNQCELTCIQASNLKRHIMTHNGEKPNKCNQCDYACVQATDLQKLMRTHTALCSKG